MITEDLYPIALIQPNKIANKLYIVSGYASATFTRRHILKLLENTKDFEINLIIGMPNNKSDHLAFLSLHQEFGENFKGFYYRNSTPVHCKGYSWFKNDEPYIGYTGSANYSQYGFFSHLQLNQLRDDDPIQIKSLYDELLLKCIYIPDHKIVIPQGHDNKQFAGSIPAASINWEIPDKRVTISFLAIDGSLPQISGLNWGQRNGRERNQAYLSLKKDSRKESFLPELAYTFSLITDDGRSFDCVVAQQGRKAIHSTNNNSELGIYFRNRIGVELGKPVKIEDLERYGRTDYTIEKINEETFLLDFSV